MHDRDPDLDRWRALFPVTARHVYLDHAAMGPLPEPAVAAMTARARSAADDGIVPIEAWEKALEQVRADAARLVGCGADEIAFVRNTSHGLSLVAAGLDWRPGDNVLCAVSEEYPSNVYPWQRLAARGVELRAVPAPGGGVDPAAFARAADARTRLVAVSSVQYGSGYRVDLAALGQVCAERGALLCVDGIQSLGAIPCDAKALGVHFLAADSHKWMLGPAGVGVLYVDRAVAERVDPALVGWRSTKTALDFDRLALDLRPDAARFEEGSLPYALIDAMGASIRLLLDVGIDRVWARIRGLGDRLVDGLTARGHPVGSPTTPGARSGAVTFTPRTGEAPSLAADLRPRGIVVSSRRGRVRVSPHFYNTADEIDALLAGIDALGR